jgi:hypothetical protein
MSGSRRLVVTAAVAVLAVVAAVVGIVFATRDNPDETVSAAPPEPTQAPPSTPVWGFLRSDAASAQAGQVQVADVATQAGSWQDAPALADARAGVVRTATGRYTVTFPGIAVPDGRGAAVATTVGGPGVAEAVHCHTVDWTAAGAAEQVRVACRTVAGEDADSAFTAMFAFAPDSHRPAGGQPYAYFRDDKPSEAKVAPADGYSFTGPDTIEINRVGVGEYHIDLIGKPYARTGNNLQVNAVGDTKAGCNALGREAKADRQIVFVGCAVGEDKTDTPFTVVYGNQHGLLPAEAYPFGHAFNGITVKGSQAMQPPVGQTVDAWLRYSANSTAAVNKVRRLSVGSYEITFPGVGLAPDHVQVTPYGEPTKRCLLQGWTSAPAGGRPAEVKVAFRCVGPDGAPADGFASVAYVSRTEGAVIAPPRAPEPPPAPTSPPPAPPRS